MGAVAVAGITAGSLAGASAGFAASQPAAMPAASNQRVSILAVNNLGLTTTQARHWQCYVLLVGYDPGTIDGQLGTKSWKAAQKMFADAEWYKGPIDGIVGSETIKALQRFLNNVRYHLTVDGIAGPETKAAFADSNSTDWCSDL
jgi:lysozyme family protein